MNNSDPIDIIQRNLDYQNIAFLLREEGKYVGTEKGYFVGWSTVVRRANNGDVAHIKMNAFVDRVINNHYVEMANVKRIIGGIYDVDLSVNKEKDAIIIKLK